MADAPDTIPLRWRTTRRVAVEGVCHDDQIPVGRVWLEAGRWHWEMGISPNGTERMTDRGTGLDRNDAKARLEAAYSRAIRGGRDTRRKLQQRWRMGNAVAGQSAAAEAVRSERAARDKRRDREKR